MPTAEFQRLRIPSHYYVYSDPPDKNGDELLHFVSPQRRLTLRGHTLREFVQRVIPLLDGHRTVSEVKAQVTDLFAEEDLAECIDLLSENRLLEDVSTPTLPADVDERLRPQLNLFHELSSEPDEIQRRLMLSRVTVFGLSGPGATAARALASTGVGFLRCVDDAKVQSADLYLSSEFASRDCGRFRCDAFKHRVEESDLSISCEAVTEPLPDDPAVEAAIERSDFVINCMDEGKLSLAYRLNRACLKTNTPWTTVASAGLEVILGPTVYPNETACFMCYRMRMVACAENPESALDFEAFLDRRKRDDSGHRPNITFGVAIAGQLAGLEAVKALSGAGQPATRGRIQIIDLRDLSSTKHTVLRKPWCPACFNKWDMGDGK